jgi:cation diffusion facilitator CzcD-associated flavoprotein CzcO
MPIAITPPYEGLPPHTNCAGYTVPDVTLRDPKNRPMRVVTVGAGYSGIMLAYKIERELQNVEHVIYEKNGDIGGAWLENRYPNCACDGYFPCILLEPSKF